MELLDLSKVAHHDTITMPGGAIRDVINNTDLGAYEFGLLNALQLEAARLDKAVRGAKVTPAKEKQLLNVLGKLVKLLIPTITAAELAKLSRANREQIVLVWIGHHTSEGDAADPPVTPRPRPTGGGSSRGSKRSTAATRKTGSTSRAGR